MPVERTCAATVAWLQEGNAATAGLSRVAGTKPMGGKQRRIEPRLGNAALQAACGVVGRVYFPTSIEALAKLKNLPS